MLVKLQNKLMIGVIVRDDIPLEQKDFILNNFYLVTFYVCHSNFGKYLRIYDNF